MNIQTLTNEIAIAINDAQPEDIEKLTKTLLSSAYLTLTKYETHIQALANMYGWVDGMVTKEEQLNEATSKLRNS